MSIGVALVLCSPVLEASELPTANEVLQELQISDRDRQRIREGNIVTWTATEGSDRELALGMALPVKTSAENLVELFREATAFKAESAIVTAYGRITGDGELADFTALKLEPNGEKEARRYLKAKPGDELNLDTKEIAAFQALKSGQQGRDGADSDGGGADTRGVAGALPGLSYERPSRHCALRTHEQPARLRTRRTIPCHQAVETPWRSTSPLCPTCCSIIRPPRSRKARSSKNSFSG